MAETTTASAATGAGKRVTLQCQFCLTWNRVDAGRVSDRPKCGKCSRPILLDRPVPLSEETFDRTIKESEVPILVDFYADWCAPCKMMAPYVDEIAAAYQGRALVAKLNTDLAQDTSTALGIRGIPTVIVYRGGAEVARQTGAVPKAKLEELLKKAL
ncbi:MAG: thioredoxin [Gemmatimonadaceae bacterium]